MALLKPLKTDKKLNALLHLLLTKYLTPVVLLGGLLFLALIHYQGVLKVTTISNSLYHGITAYSSGPLQTTFQYNSGIDRPRISYNAVTLLTYAEWNSSISVDGNVQNLWDNSHGYDQDTQKNQVFSTISGQGWELQQIVTLVNAHTVTVHYDFTATKVGFAKLHDVVLNIVHTHASWSSPTIHDNTFIAGVQPDSISKLDQPLPKPIGTISVTVDGPGAASSPITINDLFSNVSSNGTTQSVATSMTTSYHLTNPDVNKLTPLGTETITFSTSAPNGTPFPGVPSPTSGNNI